MKAATVARCVVITHPDGAAETWAIEVSEIAGMWSRRLVRDGVWVSVSTHPTERAALAARFPNLPGDAP